MHVISFKLLYNIYIKVEDFPGGSVVKNLLQKILSLKKKMATLSSILPWRNLWTEEGLQKSWTQLRD